MALLDDADLRAIIDAVGGVDVILNTGYSIRGDFRRPSVVVSPYDGGVETSRPTVRLLTVDVDEHEISHGTLLTIGNDEYCVIGHLPADSGFTLCTLTKDF